ncbi:hypothetical protein AB0B89_15370 [Sphaerisporangium sp. NPDC049002]|uniref:hypothetical protein n=1 Tax=unclassified Sphaerisporangium TaxID=2630420 RepID=UPI0033C9F71C
MTPDPYTYITVSVGPDRAPRVGVAFYTGELRIYTATLGDTRPLLSFGAAEGDVSISTTGAGPVTEQDVTVARELFQAAARYLADCERLYAAHLDQTDTSETAA